MIRTGCVAIFFVIALSFLSEATAQATNVTLLIATAVSFLMHRRHEEPLCWRLQAAFMTLLLLSLVSGDGDIKQESDRGFVYHAAGVGGSLRFNSASYQQIIKERRELRQKDPDEWKRQVLQRTKEQRGNR